MPSLAQPLQLEDTAVIAAGRTATILVPCTVDHNPGEHEQSTTRNEWRLEGESGRHQLIADDACYRGYDAIDERCTTKNIGKRRLVEREVVGRRNEPGLERRVENRRGYTTKNTAKEENG